MLIDSHQHFWKYHPVKDAWITDDMKVLQQDFLPEHLLPLLQENGLDGCVAVQADQSEAETHFLLQLADANELIKGVVGWVDLRDAALEERLEYFTQFEKLKGFRHIVQAEPQDDFLLRKDFCSGINLLSKYNFTYDVLIFPKHLLCAFDFLKQHPHQKFVIDHLAKPNFRQSGFAFWERHIRAIASLEHVSCKVSGMVTEADWKNWKQSDFAHCLDVITEAFGPDRLLFGSDWPVCLLAADYQRVFGIVQDYYAAFSETEKQKIYGGNATAFYGLRG